ncbi:unnamed protein product [Lactuca virosa]|uniref:Uncharacterized protein n=1 Tax=Lactuca virosa TaxID=75947 RepID=A0AAU9LWC1_9ASTR|nr:unnamed protein product [Lactuca virosa]
MIRVGRIMTGFPSVGRRHGLFSTGDLSGSQVVSRRRSAVAYSVLGEDVGGDTISRRLRWKRNIESFLAKSPVVIEIGDGDEMSAAKAVCSHRQGKTIVAGVDRVVESSEFVPGIRRVKAVCVVIGVERGKQAALVFSSSSGSGRSEPGVVAQSTDPMHAAIRAFVETDFTSYLRLGELGLSDLRHLCSEEEDTVPDDGVEGGV